MARGAAQCDHVLGLALRSHAYELGNPLEHHGIGRGRRHDAAVRATTRRLRGRHGLRGEHSRVRRRRDRTGRHGAGGRNARWHSAAGRSTEIGIHHRRIGHQLLGRTGADDVAVVEQVAAVRDRQALARVLLHQQNADAGLA